MKRGHPDNLEFFLSNIGKIYMNGSVHLPFCLYLMVLRALLMLKGEVEGPFTFIKMDNMTHFIYILPSIPNFKAI